MKYLAAIVIFLTLNNAAFCQSKSNNSFEKHDYFLHDYKHLDNNFKIINMSDQMFQEAIQKYNYYPERIKTYKDSLSVIMSLEFDNDTKKVHAATFTIGYSWLRASYHLWMSVEETREFAKRLNFNHPYLFMEYLRDPISNKDPQVEQFFKKLREKLSEDFEEELKSKKSNKAILNLALVKNPERIKDLAINQYKKEHGKLPPKDFKLGKGCGKKNCCQTNH